MKNKTQPESGHAAELNGHRPPVQLRSRSTLEREQHDLAALERDAQAQDQHTGELRAQKEMARQNAEQLAGEITARQAELTHLTDVYNGHRSAYEKLTRDVEDSEAEAGERHDRVEDKRAIVALLTAPQPQGTPVFDEVHRYQTGPQRLQLPDVEVANGGPGDTQVSPAVQDARR